MNCTRRDTWSACLKQTETWCSARFACSNLAVWLWATSRPSGRIWSKTASWRNFQSQLDALVKQLRPFSLILNAQSQLAGTRALCSTVWSIREVYDWAFLLTSSYQPSGINVADLVILSSYICYLAKKTKKWALSHHANHGVAHWPRPAWMPLNSSVACWWHRKLLSTAQSPWK